MDLQKILSGVKSLNDYIAATEKVVSKSANIKIHLNMSTVLNLKKVRSLEIEYFNKCEDVGAAFVLFERMLSQPPSKTWALLGKELTATILYWLDAVRKHLITHSPRWWSFLATVLKFIRGMKSKDPSLPGIIVEQTTECLLDLSCNGQLDELQRHSILQTVNECSAESSRELRLKMKDKLSGYFVKLSHILPTCGHFPTQMSILEGLLRWLVGRIHPQVRGAAARAWFPRPPYQETAVELFLERTWVDFFQNAREFLNLQNAGCPDLVTSTICKTLTFGDMELINGPQTRPTWLDINAATRSITIVLDPRVLESFAPTDYKNFETIMVSEENIFSVQLYRSSSDIMLSLHTTSPLLLLARPARALCAAVSSRGLPALDRALRAVCGHKYRVLLNVDDVSTSPETKKLEPSNKQVRSADEIRRSDIPLRRRKQSGFVVRSRNPLQFNTPSSTSTTSLAQLHERLAALPPIYYNKEPIKICAEPKLSMVSEGEERSFSQSSVTKSKHFGSCHATLIIDSDDRTFSKQSEAPPVTEKNDKPVSSMLIATLGSTDETFINDTLEKITANHAEFDLGDLIVKEALQSGPDKDSGITIDKKTQDSEVIENTPAEKQVKNKKLTRTRKAKCTVVSNSTTDESNTEPVIEVTEPCFVTDRKKRLKSKDNSHSISEESKSFDAAAVDAFFSQHYAEDAAGCVVLSPTLARRLNETPTDGSECNQNDLGEELIKNDLAFEADIIHCLNNIVDEVCCNLEKYVESLNKQQRQTDVSKITQNVDQHEKKDFIMNEPKTSDKLKSNDGAKVISLKYPSTKKRAPKKKTNQKNATKDKKTNMSSRDDDNVFIEDTDTHSPVNKPNTSLIRKKRKLYSPKDDEQNEDDIPIAKLPSRLSTETPIATCYKELELARQTRSRIPRKLRISSAETSPKTKKLNDMFDKLKERVENEETITLVKRKSNKRDMTVYNFTSDSEDEDFKKKKDLKKRVSRTSVESSAKKRGKPASRTNYSEGNYSSDENKKTTKKRKVVRQTKPRSRKVSVVPNIDLVDERMREAPPDVLDTSFVKEVSVEKIIIDPEPTLSQAPEVEIIVEDNDAPIAIPVPEIKSQKKKKAEILQVKKEKESSKNVSRNREILSIKKEKGTNKKVMAEKVTKRADSGSESSLPGLVVESEKPRKDVMSSSVEANLMQKFKKIYTEGPDVDDSDATQNLLKTDKAENLHESNKDDNLVMCENNFTDDPMNEDLGEDFDIIDLNKNAVNQKATTEPILLSESPTERSIETGGRSPITGHNDLDESPPNTASLQEKFPDRNLEIQDMDQSMADFFVHLRSALQCPESSTSVNEETTSGLPLTRMSSKEQAVTSEANPTEQVTSQKSSVKDKVTTPISSLKTLKVLLPVDEIEKYLSSVKSQKTVSMSSASVVLQRISSDEINKWLPMPRASSDDSKEYVKKHDTKLATKKPREIKRKTKERKVKTQRIRASISPIMLSFNVTGNKADSDSSANENIDVGNLPTTRSKAKQLKHLKPHQTNSREKSTLKESSSGNILPEPFIQPPKHNAPVEMNENASGSVQTIASINEWFKKNTASSQYSSSKDKSNYAVKDMVEKMMETLETTLTEIHQATGKKLASMFVDTQKRLSSLEQDLRATNERINAEIIASVTTVMRFMAEKAAERDLRFREMITEFQKEQKERACDIIVEDKKQKILMVALLKEDLEAVLDSIARQNK